MATEVRTWTVVQPSDLTERRGQAWTVRLDDRQREVLACLFCGERDRAPMVPIGWCGGAALNQCQVFAHPLCVYEVALAFLADEREVRHVGGSRTVEMTDGPRAFIMVGPTKGNHEDERHGERELRAAESISYARSGGAAYSAAPAT